MPNINKTDYCQNVYFVVYRMKLPCPEPHNYANKTFITYFGTTVFDTSCETTNLNY